MLYQNTIIFFLQELYSERYENIAVMFASIPNYKEFYDESDVNKQGLECLRLLNEIICDFDKVINGKKLKQHIERTSQIISLVSFHINQEIETNFISHCIHYISKL